MNEVEERNIRLLKEHLDVLPSEAERLAFILSRWRWERIPDDIVREISRIRGRLARRKLE